MALTTTRSGAPYRLSCWDIANDQVFAYIEAFSFEALFFSSSVSLL